MSLFSQRKGFRPLSKVVQKDGIDQELRNGLWSALKITVWDKYSPPDRFAGSQSTSGRAVENVLSRLWVFYFKFPIDTKPDFLHGRPQSGYDHIREYFYVCEWWQVFDLIEFVAKTIPEDWEDNYRDTINNFLKIENSAYRLIGLEVAEITDDGEIAAIDEGLASRIDAVRTHLASALEKLSDRKAPDYRNSIKESISAVEAMCRLVTKKESASLGDCLSTIKKKKVMHPAFEQALTKLYGYSSDADGIRHSLDESANALSYADAKFFLVACSAFVNYLTALSSELAL